jgi:nucleoside triphosphate diphosphatase
MSAAESAITALLELMERLRDPKSGCPWDQKQTFATVAPYTIEEAYEVADAIEKGDPKQLRDELGDLLFQVVFHARMAQERGWFDFAQVASAIHEKLVRRHPHVFGGESIGGEAELSRQWEEQKARERAAAAVAAAAVAGGGGTRGVGEGDGGGGADGGVGGEPVFVSALADVPRGLPALVRAAKLGKRAGRVGFDWTEAAQVREKVLEELAEVDAALADAAAGGAAGGTSAGGTNSPAVVEEMGDLLFALTNWSRHLKFDAEEALRAANAKFERRFRDMESLARERGLPLENLSPEEWEGLWDESKASEKRS